MTGLSYGDRPGCPTPSRTLEAALASPDDRTRWGATRVFAAHFSALAKRPEKEGALAKLTDDPAVTVRMNAVKGLWQFWFWTPDVAVKSRIEDSVLGALGKPQPAWVASNLHNAVYNLADENIRYLYNNWVALLAFLLIESFLAWWFGHNLTR